MASPPGGCDLGVVDATGQLEIGRNIAVREWALDIGCLAPLVQRKGDQFPHIAFLCSCRNVVGGDVGILNG